MPTLRLVSVLFNESKLLKWICQRRWRFLPVGFSTLQRVEIAEIILIGWKNAGEVRFSTLQRVEIAEIERLRL